MRRINGRLNQFESSALRCHGGLRTYLDSIAKFAFRFDLSPLGSHILNCLTLCQRMRLLIFSLLLCSRFVPSLCGGGLLCPFSFYLLLRLTLCLLALLPRLLSPLFQFVTLRIFGFSQTRFHLIRDTLDLLLAERLLHCGQKFPLIVSGMLPEAFLQVLEPLMEGFVVLRQTIDFGKLCPQLLIFLDRVSHNFFHLGMTPEDRKKVLLLRWV